jgi:hypothetical protein
MGHVFLPDGQQFIMDKKTILMMTRAMFFFRINPYPSVIKHPMTYKDLNEPIFISPPQPISMTVGDAVNFYILIAMTQR